MRNYLKKKRHLIALITAVVMMCAGCGIPLSQKVEESNLTITVEEYVNTKAAQGEDTVLGVCHGVWLREVGEYLYDGALGVGAAFLFNTPKVRTFAIY